MRKRHYEKNIR